MKVVARLYEHIEPLDRGDFTGADAEAMFERVEPLVRKLPIGQNARVVVRHGKPSLSPRTIRMPRH